jgi:hypothetical protein
VSGSVPDKAFEQREPQPRIICALGMPLNAQVQGGALIALYGLNDPVRRAGDNP